VEPGEDSPADPSERCVLEVFPGKEGQTAVVVLSGPGRMTEFRPGYFGNHSRLNREFVRQAVLLAAREGLNLSVRDTAIGDPRPAGKPALTLELDALVPGGRQVLVLARGEGAARKVLFKKALRDTDILSDFKTLAESGEALSKKELVDVLVKAGITRGGGPKIKDEPIPDEVEGRLDQMAFAEQFAALRQLHAAVRSQGGTAARYAALARGYANLALLTDYQWDAAAAAFKARAFLYAQRLVAAEPKSPVGLWHRAYVATLGGVPRIALQDLNAANKLMQALPAGERPTLPGWVRLIRSCCRYDHETLNKGREGRYRQLAALLHLLTLEHPGHTDVALRAARTAIEANVECFRAHDALCRVDGVANMHVATTFAPEVLAKAVPRRIAALPGLPDSVLKTMRGNADEPAMTRALDEAAAADPDAAEPSWGALAKIVRETRFAFTYQRLYFMRDMWSVPLDEYWGEVRPLVAGHRFEPFLAAFAGDISARDYTAFVESLDTSDVGLNASPIGWQLQRANLPNAVPVGGIAGVLSDWTVRDVAMNLTAWRNDDRYGPDIAQKLLHVSPRAPYGAAMWIDKAWKRAEANLDAWKKVIGDHPTFVAAMARHYEKVGPPEDAEQALKRSIELSPDRWAFEMLAEHYKKKGDKALWKSTLDDFLARTEDHGLDHARVRVDIANALMAEGRFADARPYADAAAQTWAGWAMQCAQACAEGQQDWEAAETWARAGTERYPGTMWTTWLTFCERTGKGDIAAARAGARAYAAGLLGDLGLSTDNLLLAAYALLLAGDNETAGAALERMKQDLDNPIYVTSMFAVAELVHDARTRDAAAERFCNTFAKTAPKSTRVFELLRDGLKGGKPGSLDLKAIDAVLESIPEGNRGNTTFPIAAHLTASGRRDEAKRYWTTTAQAANTNFWWRVIALSTLREGYPHDPAGVGGEPGAKDEPRKEP
jgi:hypothetical protein